MQDADALVAEILRRHLPSVRTVESSDHEADLQVVLKNGDRAFVEVKTAAALRRDDLLGRFALEALTLRRWLPPSSIGVATVVVPRATRSAADDAARFFDEYAPELGWALVGRDGSLHLSIPQWSVRVSEGFRSRAHRAPVEEEPLPLFRDLHEWLLKIVLLEEVEPPLWSGPRGPIESAADLASRAKVSANTASRFVRAAMAADFLRYGPKGLTPVRRRELIRAWLGHSQRRPARRVHVRSLYGHPFNLQAALKETKKLRWALAGFAACEKLGVLHATFGLPEVYIDGTVDEALREWDLSPSDHKSAHLVLLPRRAESIFRAAVPIDGVPTVDVLQAALDVSVHPARGVEQADYIFHDVLNWVDV